MTDNVYGAETATTTPRPIAPTEAGGSLFDAFKEAAEADIDNVVFFEIENRPNGPWYAKYNAVIGQEQIRRYRKSALGKKTRVEDADQLIANGMAVIETNIGIYRGGTTAAHQVLDAERDPLTFKSNDFLNIYPDAGSAVEALARFMGEAQLMTTGEAIYKAAGYGKDLEPVDPTEG